MLRNNFEVHYFQFPRRQKPNVPSSSQVRKTNVHKQRLLLALSKSKDFFRCFCWRQRSHRCFTGQTISQFFADLIAGSLDSPRDKSISDDIIEYLSQC